LKLKDGFFERRQPGNQKTASMSKDGLETRIFFTRRQLFDMKTAPNFHTIRLLINQKTASTPEGCWDTRSRLKCKKTLRRNSKTASLREDNSKSRKRHPCQKTDRK